jgi:hypothetical protein
MAFGCILQRVIGCVFEEVTNDTCNDEACASMPTLTMDVDFLSKFEVLDDV